MSHLPLLASGPHASLGQHAEVYGRFVGSWVGEYEDHMPDGRIETGPMEVHFFWVLQGLAMQDVWISPNRSPGSSHTRETYGTTLRVFDPATKLWRVIWLNPVKQVRYDLVGRQVGNEVIQLGIHGDQQTKWLFTQIKSDSFVWRGYVMDKDGATWRMHTEFRMRRVP